ncbi:hypothetical protein MMC11_005935 [Xylographa trunciseda]|nr:hypothetical protein [Xylographa trunciseda]
MPQLPDHSIDDQKTSENTGVNNQEELSKGRTSAHKTTGKSRKKHEAGGEQSNKEKATKALQDDVVSLQTDFDVKTRNDPSVHTYAYHSPSSPPSLPTNTATSPVLTALGGTSAFNTAPFDTVPWPSTLPLGRSPPQYVRDEVSVAGSPGTYPPYGEELRGGFSNASPATSPRSAYRVPARPNNGYQSFGDYLGSSPGRGRPVSMPAQFSMSPPLPHHPQPHFYGVSETDLGLPSSRNTRRRAGGTGFTVFDSLASTGGETSASTENVLLVAIEHGIVIYAVEKDKLHVLGRLEGFQGEVIGAKILPCQSSTDPFRQVRPLIAVILHGPILPDEESRPNTVDNHEDVSNPRGPDEKLQHDHNFLPSSEPQFQSTVEVYSLQDRRHIATIYRGPPINGKLYYGGPLIGPPAPVGSLSLQAKGRFLILSSGVSGEVHVFEVSSKNSEANDPAIKCLAKYWTSTPARKARTYSGSSTSSEAESSHEGSPNRPVRSEAPIVSLSNRWLVIAPPISSSRSTLHGIVDQSIAKNKPLWIKSHTSPAQFQVTCELENHDEETLFDRVARDVTQEVIKGAKWVGSQGIQVWNNYWNKSPGPYTLPEFGPHSHPPQQTQQNFPPTHANDDRNRINSQPTLISIVDLEKLSEGQRTKPGLVANYQPIATFALPSGCSFVSLNATGLSLLTASRKGDVTYVWDLMRVVYGRKGILESPERPIGSGAVVRRIARFPRMTVANIVDVVWTEPKGERLAMVTDRGTVHIHDLPANAFQWPPLRQIARPVTAPGGQGAAGTALVTDETSAGTGGNFFNMVSGRAQPLLAAVRGRPPSITNAISGFGGFGITAGAAAGAGAKGGKAVVAGISKSVGAATGTVNTIRHLGENRFHIPGAPHSAIPGCVRWLSGKDRSLLAVVGNGVLRVHHVRESTMVQAGRRRPSVVGGQPVEFPIPNDPARPNNVSNDLIVTENNSNSLSGYWTQSTTRAHPVKVPQHAINPLSYAEIETNAPYQPFHTDHRITLNVYKEDPAAGDIHHLQDSAPWVFGEDIPSIQVTTGVSVSSEQGIEATEQDELAGMENVISLEGDGEGGRQVVVTTRRRKRGKGEDESDDGIFEDAAEIVDFVDERV